MSNLFYSVVFAYFVLTILTIITWLSICHRNKKINKELIQMRQLNEEFANIMHTKILLARANEELNHYISHFHAPRKQDVLCLMKEIQQELDRVTKLIQEGK